MTLSLRQYIAILRRYPIRSRVTFQVAKILILLTKNISDHSKSREECKDQKSIQESSIPDLEQYMIK